MLSSPSVMVAGELSGPPPPLTPEELGIPYHRWLTPAQLATHLGCSSRTVVRSIERYDLRAVRVGSTYRIPWVEVVKFLQRQHGLMN